MLWSFGFCDLEDKKQKTMGSCPMSKISDFAKGKQCTARIPNVCTHDSTKTVWAHLNSIRWGAGRGKKAPDVCGLIACFDCHQAIDGARKKDNHGYLLDSDFVWSCALEGHMESLNLLHKEGVIE